MSSLWMDWFDWMWSQVIRDALPLLSRISIVLLSSEEEAGSPGVWQENSGFIRVHRHLQPSLQDAGNNAAARPSQTPSLIPAGVTRTCVILSTGKLENKRVESHKHQQHSELLSFLWKQRLRRFPQLNWTPPHAVLYLLTEYLVFVLQYLHWVLSLLGVFKTTNRNIAECSTSFTSAHFNIYVPKLTKAQIRQNS